MTKRIILKFVTVVTVLLLGGQAYAGPVVGIAVDDTSSTTQVGNSSADGSINFYIPLSGTETYGDGNSSDTCNFPNTCSGGSLEMHIFFGGVTAGLNRVTLDFADLDAIGVNDPWFLLEALEIRDGDGNLLHTLVQGSDFTFANNNDQVFSFDLDVAGDFYITLVMDTSFDAQTPEGWYRNTSESVLATTTSVPEPGTLALLGTGLLIFAFVGTRSRRRQFAGTRP